jgi:hypothetical protein
MQNLPRYSMDNPPCGDEPATQRGSVGYSAKKCLTPFIVASLDIYDVAILLEPEYKDLSDDELLNLAKRVRQHCLEWLGCQEYKPCKN